MVLKRSTLSILALAGIMSMFFLASVALAAAPVLFGGATMGGGYVTLVSDGSDLDPSNDFSGASFSDANGTTFGALTTLSTDYNVTDDNCGGGSPRFSIRIDTDGDNVSNGSIHVAIGPSPGFTGCTAGWQSTGNFIGNNDAGRYDFSAFGGSPFTTYSNAPASVLAGTVLGISVVVDGSWSAAATGGDGEQTILIDNTDINGVMHDFTPPPANKDECKNGGWMTFTSPSFKNQGQCVSFVVSHNPNN